MTTAVLMQGARLMQDAKNYFYITVQSFVNVIECV